MKADAAMLRIKEDLHEAKQELNEFENNYEKYMPKLRALTQFKDAAKDLFSNDIIRDKNTLHRDEKEEEIVRAKIK